MYYVDKIKLLNNLKGGKIMLRDQRYSKPVKCFLEDIGYNYIAGPGKLLHPKGWFLTATEFNDEGYAIVEDFSKKKMKIDMNGNLEEITIAVV